MSATPGPTLIYPPADALAELVQSVSLGYYRGALNALAAIERSHPDHAAFVLAMRQLAQQFAFDAMNQLLEQAPP